MLIEDAAPTANANHDCQIVDWQIQSFAAEVWLPELKKSSRSWGLSERCFRKYIQPYLGSRRFSALGKKDVAAWLAHVDVLDLAAATRNRVMFVLKSLLKMAFERKLLPSEFLADFLKKNLSRQERHNSALIESGKMRMLWRKLGQSPTPAARVIELLLLTGASKSEILSARWENLDAERNQLEVDGHNGKKRKIWLGSQTMKVFAAIARNPESPWIFPGRKPEHHLTDIFRVWNGLRKSCGLENLRIQDLRHNHVNWQNLREGYSPAIDNEIGKPAGANEQVGLAVTRVCVTELCANPDGAPLKRILGELARKFLSVHLAALKPRGKNCQLIFAAHPQIQRDFSFEICRDYLNTTNKKRLPPSVAGYLKEELKLSGTAIALENKHFVFPAALRLARASFLAEDSGDALVASVAMRAGKDGANQYRAVIVHLNASPEDRNFLPLEKFLIALTAWREKRDVGEESLADGGINSFLALYEYFRVKNDTGSVSTLACARAPHSLVPQTGRADL